VSAIPKRIKTVIIRVNGKPGRNATSRTYVTRQSDHRVAIITAINDGRPDVRAANLTWDRSTAYDEMLVSTLESSSQ
jgi:hypothetical protein